MSERSYHGATSRSTSILKDIAEKSISKTSAVPKRFDKPCFTDTCKDVTKERSRALQRFKCEPTMDNLDDYRIARAKARRDIRHSKKTSWRNYISKINSKTSVKSVWNRICIIKGKEPSNTIHHLSMSMIEMSRLNVTLLMHWQISFLIILPLLSADMHMFVRKLQGRIYTFHLIILKYTSGPSLLKSCRMLIEPMIVQQDQMKYTISYLNIYLVPLYYFS